ncbi:nuclear transport factor 2 family protein [Parasphingorhabdus pacifica]
MQHSPARGEIENTLNRYALGYDEGDLDLVADTLTEGAALSMRVGGGELVGPFEGRETILELFRETAKSQEGQQRRHITSNVLVDVHDGSATSLSYVTIFAAADGGLRAVSTGKYEDELVRTDGGWRFTHRHLVLDLPY